LIPHIKQVQNLISQQYRTSTEVFNVVYLIMLFLEYLLVLLRLQQMDFIFYHSH